MKLKLLLFILVISLTSFSQDKKEMFYGSIYDSLQAIPNVHIINITGKNATYSKENGTFRIPVQISDSLKITAIGYKTYYLKIESKEINTPHTRIILQKEVYELDEIEIKKHQLTGSLYSDLKQVSHTPEVNAKTLKLPNSNKTKFTLAERRFYTASGGGNILSLDNIVNTINGEKKRLKKLLKIEKKEKEIASIRKTYKRYFLTDLAIDSIQLNRFIYYCQEDKDFRETKQKGDYYLINFFKQKAIEFKKE